MKTSHKPLALCSNLSADILRKEHRCDGPVSFYTELEKNVWRGFCTETQWCVTLCHLAAQKSTVLLFSLSVVNVHVWSLLAFPSIFTATPPQCMHCLRSCIPGEAAVRPSCTTGFDHSFQYCVNRLFWFLCSCTRQLESVGLCHWERNL